MSEVRLPVTPVVPSTPVSGVGPGVPGTPGSGKETGIELSDSAKVKDFMKRTESRRMRSYILSNDDYNDVFSTPLIVVSTPGKTEKLGVMEDGDCRPQEVFESPVPPPEGGSLTRTPVSWKTIGRPLSFQKDGKAIGLRNYALDSTVYDTLHCQAEESHACTETVCQGSLMNQVTPTNIQLLADDALLKKAQQFIRQYYNVINKGNSRELRQRITDMTLCVSVSGTYHLTQEELLYAAKLAWRNAPRCSGRTYWTNLHLIDGRKISSGREMFHLLCQHLRYATNRGNIRPTITVFPQLQSRGHAMLKIWNNQLISYAGYRQADGTVIGDPSNVDFTQVCLSLGWRGKKGRFDVLPWVLQEGHDEPEVYEIPPDLVLEVIIKHPKYRKLECLGLRWYSLPAISNNGLEAGGLLFSSCAFNGWYLTNEVASRDLCDDQRYNLIQEVADAFDVDKSSQPLWKDITVIELNSAVQHSFQTAGVTIVNHHSLCESFQRHFIKEHETRGGCPSDWVWIVPPVSGSITSLFHQEMLYYQLTPRYYYLPNAWTGYERSNRKEARKTPLPKLQTVGWALRFLVRTMRSILRRRSKVTILYGSETGTAEKFALELGDAFKTAFDVRVLCMADYEVCNLKEERLVMMVASTTGNGDPPYNAQEFAKGLVEMVSSTKRRPGSSVSVDSVKRLVAEDAGLDNSKPLSRLRYAVFALGSRAYPRFCGFGKFLDFTVKLLGGQSLLRLADGDEMCGQDVSFYKWAHRAFQVTCETCNVRHNVQQEALSHLTFTVHEWAPGRFRLTESSAALDTKLALCQKHRKDIHAATLTDRQQLLQPEPMRKTMLVKLRLEDAVTYTPGDHVFLYVQQPATLVDDVMSALEQPVHADVVYNLEYLCQNKAVMVMSERWVVADHLPVVTTVRHALTWLLDLTHPPSQYLLSDMASFATDEIEAYRIKQLANDQVSYDRWVDQHRPNLAEVLSMFPSVCLPPVFLLSQLPVLQPRVYSVSSCQDVCPGQVHLTVSLTQYKTSGGTVRTGLCSGWLDELTIGSRLYCHILRNPGFQLPVDSLVPVVLVACGTGIAPFRSFWQSQLYSVSQDSEPGTHRPMYLYFGCRTPSEYLYQDEVLQAVSSGVLTASRVAYSRQAGQEKRYVQELLEEDGVKMADLLLREHAAVYVCGHVSLNEGVEEAVVKVLVKHGQMTGQEARDIILDMKAYGRYKEETFGAKRETLRQFRSSLTTSRDEN